MVIPSTFVEPIAPWLRTHSTNEFLHTQIFVGFMFMAACSCLWLVRAWKISESQNADAHGTPLKQEAPIRGNDAVGMMGSSVPDVNSMAKVVKGLFPIARV